MALVESKEVGGISSSASIDPIDPAEDTVGSAPSTHDEPTEVGDVDPGQPSSPIDSGNADPGDETDRAAQPVTAAKPASETKPTPKASESAPVAAPALIPFGGFMMTAEQIVEHANQLNSRLRELEAKQSPVVQPQADAIPGLPKPPDLTEEELTALDPASRKLYEYQQSAYQHAVTAARESQQQRESEQFWQGITKTTQDAFTAEFDTHELLKDTPPTLRNLTILALENQVAKFRHQNPRAKVPDTVIRGTIKAVGDAILELAEKRVQAVTKQRIDNAKNVHQGGSTRTPSAPAAPKRNLDIDNDDSLRGGIRAALQRNQNRG